MSYVPTPPPHPGPPPDKGHALEITLGAVCGAAGLLVLTFGGLVAFSGALGGISLVVGPGLLLAAGVGMLFARPTRFWGVGVLIGAFVLLIVVGGTCVALLSSLGGMG